MGVCNVMPSVYIVNPAVSAPGYHSSEAFADECGGWMQVADLTIPTVAALVPDGWTIRLTDEHISPVDFNAEGDFVAITGKVTQRARMVELASRFRAQGRTVLIGGSFASLSPDVMRPHADVLVTGELEQLAPRLFADLASGHWADHYDGGRADLSDSPIPRWDLYPTSRAGAATLQTTRGCPFECEFCDVIQYQGRKQRHKPLQRVVKELSVLYDCGFRDVFIADDNFTAHRRWARDVLEALAAFNATHDEPMRFTTQGSIDMARDPDLLERCHAAGLRMMFVGIETNNEQSLRETRKRQNLLMPVQDAVCRIVDKGIFIMAGVVVGFDHDDPSIFDTLFEFLQQMPLPDLSVGVLTAPAATDLHRRLTKEGRLIGESWNASAGTPFETNIRPKLMSRRELLEGTLELCTRLYAPRHYERRMLQLIDRFGTGNAQPPVHSGRERSGRAHGLHVLRRLASRGPAEADMASAMLRRAANNRALLPNVMYGLARYEQARVVLEHASALAARPAC